MQHKPHQKEGKYQKYSSPVQMRRELEEKMPKGLKGTMFFVDPKMSKNPKLLIRKKPFEDTLSGSIHVYGAGPDAPYYSPGDRSLMNRTVFFILINGANNITY